MYQDPEDNGSIFHFFIFLSTADIYRRIYKYSQ